MIGTEPGPGVIFLLKRLASMPLCNFDPAFHRFVKK